VNLWLIVGVAMIAFGIALRARRRKDDRKDEDEDR